MPNRGRLVITTGPLLALIAACGDLRLLSALYQEVVVPIEVCQVIEEGGSAGFGLLEFQQAVWLKKRSSPVTLSPFLRQALDRGEGSVIQLARTPSLKWDRHCAIAGDRLGRNTGFTRIRQRGYGTASQFVAPAPTLMAPLTPRLLNDCTLPSPKAMNP